MNRAGSVLIALSGVVSLAQGAGAVAPLNTNVALQPPAGVLILDQRVQFDRGGVPPDPDLRDAERMTYNMTLVYGFTNSITGILSVPVTYLDADAPSENEWGVGDFKVLTKLRLHRNDFGPARTSRFDLIAGLEAPSGDDTFSSNSVDPIVGGVYSLVVDRHALHADVLWRFGTGGGAAGADTLSYDLAYLFRLDPIEFGPDTRDSLFGLIEFNGRYDTNGDHELVLAPGLLYAGWRVLIGANLLIPIHRNIDERFQRDIGFGLTVRWRF